MTNTRQEIVADERRRQISELEERAMDAARLEAALPHIVRRIALRVLDEAEDLDEAREMLEGSA